MQQVRICAVRLPWTVPRVWFEVRSASTSAHRSRFLLDRRHLVVSSTLLESRSTSAARWMPKSELPPALLHNCRILFICNNLIYVRYRLHYVYAFLAPIQIFLIYIHIIWFSPKRAFLYCNDVSQYLLWSKWKLEILAMDGIYLFC